MNQTPIQLARSGEELGILPLADVHALLEAGFLRSTDEYRLEETGDWKPLAELPALQQSSGLAKHIAAAAGKIAAGTRSMGDRVVTGSVTFAKTTGTAANTLLTSYLPFLSGQVAAKLSSFRRTAASALHDEVFLKKLFGAVYDSLPKAVHRFVNEQQFIDYCLLHRAQLLGPLKSKNES